MKEEIINFDTQWLLAWNRFASNSHFWTGLLTFAGQYLIYLIPIVLIVLWFFKRDSTSKKVALRSIVAGGLGLLLSKIIGPMINRPRPFETRDVQELLFHRPDYSFPSDHAIFLFAMAASIFLSGYRKLAYFLFALALIVSVSRIAIGIHFPTDIIAGALLGIILAYLVRLIDKYLDYLYNLLIKIGQKLRLA